MNSLPPPAEMQRAFLARDASYDGVFFTGVRTTGIFCRPSCSARKPLPENLEFFASVKAAVFAGYRPCKRCRPLDVSGRPPEWIAPVLARIEREPERRIRDGDLRALGIDPARARRWFGQRFGMTFQAYCRGRRMSNALEKIRLGEGLDEVAFDSGYESLSGFRERFADLIGAPPGRARDADCIRMAWVESPLGPLVAGARAEGVCLLEFTDRRMLEAQCATLKRRFRCALVPGENDHLAQLKAELAEYFAGRRRAFDVPLLVPGTPFQERVWRELLAIPYGETRSYEDLARTLGNADAQRAVGRANGMNRIAIVIPCHRVVNKTGELGGYGGGLWRKHRLLALERGGAAEDLLDRAA